MANQIPSAPDDNSVDHVRANEGKKEALRCGEWQSVLLAEPDYDGVEEFSDKLFCDGYYIDLLGEAGRIEQRDIQLND